MADFSMPNAFAQNHLNRIMKKTEKFKIIHVFNIQEEKQIWIHGISTSPTLPFLTAGLLSFVKRKS
jgi:hypothetical protein